MSVHYKFKAALDFCTVTFDGIHISVSELKKSIIDQKRLGKNADFDLQIINAQTKEVYSDENALIPKNTSVIVARVPVTDRKKSGPPPSAKDVSGRGMHHKAVFHQQSGAEVAKGSDLSSMDLTEEEKIKAMMTQSTADYDPSHYVRIRGANQHGRVPDNYRCNRCNQGGHWISRCPNVPVVQQDVKKSTGIPRSFMVVVDSPDFPGALMTPEGRYAVPAVDHAAYLEKNKGQQTVEQPAKPKIPDDLVCPLCNDLLTDALLVPCCANSYCDDCIRSYLLESEHECPGCHEKDISPTSLIPNRFLRGTVNAFKSDTGYSKPEKVPERPQKSPPKPEPPKVDESRKLSLDELPDDLFPHSPKKIDSETEGTNNTDPESTKDLYDFNDGSIPSPFASPKHTETKLEPVQSEQRAIQSLSRPFHGGPASGMMRGPPGPPHHPPHHMIRKPHPLPSSVNEPPPPGFDVLPPGEDGSHRPQSHGPNGGPQGPGSIAHDNNQRDPSGGPSRGPPQQQQAGPQMSMPPNVPPPSFNPMQPPPGYPGGPPPGHGPPQGPPPPGGPPGLPPSGFGPPGGPLPPGPSQNMPPYGNNYNRPPMPHMGRGPPPGHHGGPPPRHHMDHDDYGHRGRGRRPYGHGGPPHRMDEPHREREEESRLGIIDDPLKEFERLMREKDRRKKLAQTSGPRKRSKSRSFSPVPRRISPYPQKRSRSRSFSRSPSPKRKRPPPVPKRRRSYSRSPSRSPRPLRRVGKSRSRSRNRSMSPPPPQGKNKTLLSGNIRRSPRRAPPQYSPSPPSRFVRKEKEEYFEGRGRERYDDRPPRFPKPPFPGRDYENKYDNSSSNKYDTPLAPKHDASTTHKADSLRQPLRAYHGHTEHDQHSSFYRDKTLPTDVKKPFQEFDSTIAPPGTDNASGVPSLLDINVSHPSSNIYPISTIGTGIHQDHRPISDFEKGRRERDPTETKPTIPIDRKKLNAEEDHDQDSDKDHRHKKSPVAKKHKKEKRKHKKKSKDEKKTKKRKTSKDERPTDGDKSSDEEADVEGTSQIPQVIPVLDAPTAAKPTPTVATSVETQLLDSSFATRQTAPDSTVKSPDRAHDADVLPNKTEQPIYPEKSHSSDQKRRDSQSSVQHKEASDIKCNVTSDELRLPTSKWDEYEDFLVGDVPKNVTKCPDIPVATGESKREVKERIVTSDVIKRAESLIFDKPSKPLSETTKQSPELQDQILQNNSFPPEAKLGTDIPSLVSLVQPLKLDKSSVVASTIHRKSAKDRLGSKVSEDEAVLNVNKSVEPNISIKSKVSAVGESSEPSRRRRSRSRSPYGTSRYRNRSRSRSLDRLINRSRQSSERQLSRPTERDQKSPRRRERRRTHSRERRRSPSRDRRNPELRDRRSPRPKERKRSTSRERVHRSASKNRRSLSRDRKRSLSKDRHRRATSRDRKRPISRERRRSNSRSRRRSRSRSRDRRRSVSRKRARSRSIQRSPRDRKRTVSRERDPKYKRQAELGVKDESDLTDKRRLNFMDKRKDGFARSNEAASIGDQHPSPEARVFQQAGGDPSVSRSDQVFSPTLKKQKGRINIKLSSISKAEPLQSGSSSSDEDHDQPGDSKLSDTEKRIIREEPSSTTAKASSTASSKTSKNKSRPTRPIVQSTVSVVNGPITSTTKDKENKTKTTDGVPGEDGKRKKKRTHSPTSTKSSSSSDTKRKKKKKDKKKKKKKKKSKE